MTSLIHGTNSLVGRQREREQRGAWHQHVVMASAEPAAIVGPTLESTAAEAAAKQAENDIEMAIQQDVYEYEALRAPGDTSPLGGGVTRENLQKNMISIIQMIVFLI